jgi:hypothetical protein
MSQQEIIIQIMPATGWVAVYEEDGGESPVALVCFALVETEANGAKHRAVRPMCADGKGIVFADTDANYLRVEELAEFEEDEEEDDEEEEEGAEA